MSTLKNINLSTLPDITDVQDNFNTLNNDKLEVLNFIQGENITLTVNGKNITISATGGGGGTGVDGVSLQYNWDGTSLGIKREDEVLYTYVNLKGQDGVIGVDGKSAYQSWLDLGSVGTEQDFINSIKGENGLDGVDGENGKNIEMRYSETYLQYRLLGDIDWINLIQLTQSEIDLINLTTRVNTLETNQGDLVSVPIELQNKTIAEMITTNFTSVSNGKTLVANAITDKGILTLATDTFQVMADNIGAISGGTPPIGGIDEYTKLMLHGEDFTDSSFNPKTITNNGGIIATDGAFDKCINLTSGKLVIPMGDDCQFGNGDFTIDFRIKYSSVPVGQTTIAIIGNPTGVADKGLLFGYLDSGDLKVYASSDGNLWNIFSAHTLGGLPALNQWYHYALVRSGNTFHFFRNGTIVFTANVYMSFNTNIDKTLYINRKWGATDGYQPIKIDEFRISKGIARWTQNFNPPLAPYTVDSESYSLYLENQIIESAYQNL